MKEMLDFKKIMSSFIRIKTYIRYLTDVTLREKYKILKLIRKKKLIFILVLKWFI